MESVSEDIEKEEAIEKDDQKGDTEAAAVSVKECDIYWRIG